MLGQISLRLELRQFNFYHTHSLQVIHDIPEAILGYFKYEEIVKKILPYVPTFPEDILL